MTFEIVFVLLSLLGMMAALIADKMRPGMVLFSVVGFIPVCRHSDSERNARGLQ